jgi:hypothetical protein
MRIAQTLALLGVFAGGTAARAAEPAPAPAATVQQAAAPAAKADQADSLPWLGISTDVGLPDGAQGALILRPWKALRFSAGGGYNMISKGVRAGVALLPFGRGPALSLEAGRFFKGNANAPIQKFAGAGFGGVDAINNFGYDYANAHLGLDFGYRRVTFYIHGGMSYIRGTIPKEDLNSTFNKDPSINGQNSSGLQVRFTQDAPFRAIGPSAKIGLIVYLW